MTARRRLHLACALAAAFVCCGCVDERALPVSIRFEARANGLPYSCDPSSSKTADGSTVTGLAFFVQDVALIDANGLRHPVALYDDGTWQSAGVALLDFEDATGVCINGTEGVRTTVTGTVEGAIDETAALEFSVGVPFALNHQDPARASAPLAGTRMHWSWRGGYKFLRVDGAHTDGDGFRIHIGSTGCEGRITEILRCARPNRPRVLISRFVPATDSVVFDLDRLTAVGAKGDGAHSIGCMAGAEEPGCATVFAALGLDIATGLPGGSAGCFRRGVTERR